MSISKALRRALAIMLAGSLPLAAHALNLNDDTDPLTQVKKAGVLDVALYEEFPPYSYADDKGQPAGIDVDLAKALAVKLGVTASPKLYPAEETLSDDLRNRIWKGHYLGGGVADLMLHVGYDPQTAAREPKVYLFAPYLHEEIAAVYHPDAVKNPDAPMALTGHKVAVEGDSISDLFLTSAFGGVLRGTAVRKGSLSEAVGAFKAGEADVVMGPHGEVQGLLSQQGVDKVVFHRQNFVGQFRSAWDLGFAVRNAGNPSLRDALAGALSALQKDGTVAKIFKAHGVDYVMAPAEGGAQQASTP